MTQARDMKTLKESICEGIVQGNAPVVAAFTRDSDRRHDLSNAVETNTLKITQLDIELSLLKGYMAILIGEGKDGSTGTIPRMEQGMQDLRNDVTSLKGQVVDLTKNVEKMSQNVETIMSTQVKQSLQTSWTQGWKGVGAAIGVVAACVSIIGAMIAGIIWLYTHGGAIR